jgi:hypothetical protein
VLVPAKIDEVDPPLGFMMIQAADLVDWSGDRRDPRWAFFLEAVRGILHGGASLTAAPAGLTSRTPTKSPRWQVPMLAAVAAVALISSAALVWNLLRDRAPAPVVTAPPAPQQQPQKKISENEQKLWDKAVMDKTRQGFQTYLVSYPDGAYAQRARDTLLTCRTETKEVWKPGPDVANQMLRGVSGGALSSGTTPEQHCSKAKDDVRALAKRLCETIVTNGGYRNAKWTVADSPCDCKQPNNVVMNCIADLAYSCRWEMRVTERIEICG